MEKFRLTKNDVKSLESSVKMINNPILQKSVLDILGADSIGGGENNPSSVGSNAYRRGFAKILPDESWAKVIG